jgi:hypothetical protein
MVFTRMSRITICRSTLYSSRRRRFHAVMVSSMELLETLRPSVEVRLRDHVQHVKTYVEDRAVDWLSVGLAVGRLRHIGQEVVQEALVVHLVYLGGMT